MLRYIQKGVFIPNSPTDIASIGEYGEHIVDFPTLIQSYINQGLITVSSGAGWSLTGNEGTDYETNFLGTTDDQILVLASNNKPMFAIGQESFNLSTTNILSPSSDYSSLEGDSSRVFASIYEEGDVVIKSTLDNTGYYLQCGNQDAFTVKQDTGNVGIGFTNNTPLESLDVLGNVLVHDEAEPLIKIESDINENSDSYWGLQVKNNTYTDYLKLGSTGGNYGTNILESPYYDGVNYVESFQKNLAINSISGDGVGKIFLDTNYVRKIEVSEGVTINPGLNELPSANVRNFQINQESNDSSYGIKLCSTTGENWSLGVNSSFNLDFAYLGTTVGTFDRTSGAYTPISDERLKQNIVPLIDEDLLLQLEPKQFTFKSDDTDKKRYGLIAQEVKLIIPEIVIGDENAGNLTVDYTSLIPLLIKRIQTLTAQVNALMQ